MVKIERAKKRTNRTCEYCGKGISVALNANAKHCSRRCSKDAYNMALCLKLKAERWEKAGFTPTQICKNCHATFTATLLGQKFCCQTCRWAYHNLIDHAKQQEQRVADRDNGVCTYYGCNNKASGGFYCPTHRAVTRRKQRSRQEDRKNDGACVQCGQQKAAVGILCCDCWYKQMAGKHTKRAGSAGYLKALLESTQNGRCAITGREISPSGDSSRTKASIDHEIPKAQGGNGDLKNLQWVAFDINMMKRDKTTPELFETIKEITDGAVYQSWLTKQTTK